jgi:hypothetical protein
MVALLDSQIFRVRRESMFKKSRLKFEKEKFATHPDKG